MNHHYNRNFTQRTRIQRVTRETARTLTAAWAGQGRLPHQRGAAQQPMTWAMVLDLDPVEIPDTHLLQRCLCTMGWTRRMIHGVEHWIAPAAPAPPAPAPHDLMAEWLEHEARTGFDTRKIFVSDGETIIIPPLDPPQPPTPDDDSLRGWTLTDIERRVRAFAASLRQGTPTQARITQRLRELGWHHRRERIGPRKLNQKTWKWFLDPAVRKSLTAGDPTHH